MKTSIKLPKTMYVVRNSTSSGNLSYMTSADDRTTKAFATRKSTGLSWAGASRVTPYERYFGNTPQHGVRVCGFSSRYSTSNKVIQIEDPRDFTVEVPVENLISIMQETTLVNGVIQEEVVWARDGQNHVLVTVGSELYQTITQANQQPISASEFQPGDELGDSRVYLGKMRIAAKARYEPRQNSLYRYDRGDPFWVDLGEATLYAFRRGYNFGPSGDRKVYLEFTKSFPKTTERLAGAKSPSEVNEVIEAFRDRPGISSTTFDKAAKAAVIKELQKRTSQKNSGFSKYYMSIEVQLVED